MPNQLARCLDVTESESMRRVSARATCGNLLRKPTLAVSLSLLTASGYAAAPATACNRELRQRVVPTLQGVAMDRKNVQAKVEDGNGGVYSVRLFVAADSPDNRNRQGSIGWIDLDVNAMKAFDVTKDPDSPVALDVNKEKFAAFVKNCLK